MNIMSFSTKSIVIALLLIAALGVLAAFQFWLVAAAMLLLLAGFALHDSDMHSKSQKLEMRVSIVQASLEEWIGKVSQSICEISDAANMLRGELKQVAGNVEARIAAVEERGRANILDAQKYYDLVQKIIELENRVSAIVNKEKEEPQF